jgi:hypothetical protein
MATQKELWLQWKTMPQAEKQELITAYENVMSQMSEKLPAIASKLRLFLVQTAMSSVRRAERKSLIADMKAKNPSLKIDSLKGKKNADLKAMLTK